MFYYVKLPDKVKSIKRVVLGRKFSFIEMQDGSVFEISPSSGTGVFHFKGYKKDHVKFLSISFLYPQKEELRDRREINNKHIEDEFLLFFHSSEGLIPFILSKGASEIYLKPPLRSTKKEKLQQTRKISTKVLHRPRFIPGMFQLYSHFTRPGGEFILENNKWHSLLYEYLKAITDGNEKTFIDFVTDRRLCSKCEQFVVLSQIFGVSKRALKTAVKKNYDAIWELKSYSFYKVPLSVNFLLGLYWAGLFDFSIEDLIKIMDNRFVKIYNHFLSNTPNLCRAEEVYLEFLLKERKYKKEDSEESREIAETISEAYWQAKFYRFRDYMNMKVFFRHWEKRKSRK